MNHLAPIAISVYKRLDHARETINALKVNKLASESELYVFSDGPQSGDERSVAEMREYLRTINGFRRVSIIGRDKNSRVFNNRDGMRAVLEEHGKILWLEEDNVTAPGFLTFMNQALEAYSAKDWFFSVTGYCPPISIPKSYIPDAFSLRRFSAWGFGITLDRFNMVTSITPDDYSWLTERPSRVRDFIKGAGMDMLNKVERESRSLVDAFDIRSTYRQFRENLYTVVPRKSLVSNIGFDGTGTHTRENNKYDVQLWSKTCNFNLHRELQSHRSLIMANYTFRQKKSINSIHRLIDRYALHPYIKHYRSRFLP